MKKVFAICLAAVFMLFAVGCEMPEPSSDRPSSSGSKVSDTETFDLSDETDETDVSDTSETGSESEEPSDTSETGSEPEEPSDTSESGDDPIDPPDEPEPVHPDTSDIKKILFIGNSHAKDTYVTLPELFKAEGYNGYTFGLAYIGETHLSHHAANITNNSAKYLYYLSENKAGYTNPNGKDSNKNYILATFESILQDKDWDLVIMLIHRGDIFDGDNCAAASRETIVNHIHSIRPNAKIGTVASWLTPYADDMTAVYANASYNEVLQLYTPYGTSDAERFAHHCTVVKNNILNDPTYYINFSVGNAAYYANKILGVASGNVNTDATCLYRDYVHMSIYGRAIVSYAFFAQFTGQEIDHVSINAVTAYVGNGAYYDKANCPALTAEQKNVIIQTANYTFNHPWTVPTAA